MYFEHNRKSTTKKIQKFANDIVSKTMYFLSHPTEYNPNDINNKEYIVMTRTRW